MSAPTAQAMADYIRAHAEVLADAYVQEFRPTNPEEAHKTQVRWLRMEADTLLGKEDRAKEWATIYCERIQREGGDLKLALQNWQWLREHLSLKFVNNLPQFPPEEIHAILADMDARYTNEIVDFFTRAHMQILITQRRREQSMLDSLQHAYATLDAEGGIVMASRLLGEYLDTPPNSLLGETLAQFCAPNTSSELRRNLRSKRTGGPFLFEGTLRPASGKTLPCQFSVKTLYDQDGRRNGAAVSISTKATDETSSAPDLMAVLERLGNFLPVKVQVFEQSRQILFEKGSLTSLTQENGEENRPLCCRLMQNRHGHQPCVCENVFATGEPYQGQVSYGEGEYTQWFELSVGPLLWENETVVRVACAVREITAQRNLENQILRQQRNSLVSQVAMTVAHQLRNPLGVMIGFAEMLANNLPPEEIPGAANTLLRNGVRCKEIVEDLLEFGQGYPSAWEATDLRQLVRDLVQPLFTESQLRHIHWHMPDQEVLVECAPNQLAQVFANLLDNALLTNAAQIEFDLYQTGANVTVEVCDNGPGIPEELRSRVFQPFFTTRKADGGVGLGLSLSQAVVAECGGRLSLMETDTQKGACFHVQLPLLNKDDNDDTSATPPADTPPRKRVLLVDDEVDLADMLATVLEQRGHQVDKAVSGSEAIGLIEQTDYDAAVLDIVLPGDLSGPDIFSWLKTRAPDLATRTMFITADTMSFETHRFLEESQRPSMAKPFFVYDFADRVNELLGCEQEV